MAWWMICTASCRRGYHFSSSQVLGEFVCEGYMDCVQGLLGGRLLRPAGYAIHDPGTNFATREFRDSTKIMSMETKMKPLKAHHSAVLVKWYHNPLVVRSMSSSMSWKTFRTKMDFKWPSKQSIRTDSIVPTFLVFGSYYRMTTLDVSAHCRRQLWK